MVALLPEGLGRLTMKLWQHWLESGDTVCVQEAPIVHVFPPAPWLTPSVTSNRSDMCTGGEPVAVSQCGIP